jgi:hypothetical protein
MADFNAHLTQAKRNCQILKSMNAFVSDSWDWQLTNAFYVAVHVVNGHMAKIDNQHYKSHEAIKNALFAIDKVKVPENVYLAYVKLEQLSRRARYLCSEKKSDDNSISYLTYEVHFAKAIRHLDVVLTYFCGRHKIDFPKSSLNCVELKGDTLTYFEHQAQSAA